MTQPLKIILVDDHTVVRQGLALLLSDSKYGIEVVGEAADGLEAVELARKLQPVVVLMDLMMPGMDGLTATKAIKAQQPQAGILILTSLGEDSTVEAAIKSGALGYVRKDSPASELVDAIRSVATGRLSLPQDLVAQFLTGGRKVRSPQGHPALTAREQEVLVCLAQGLTDDEIAQILGISRPTVRSHVGKILTKLDASNRTQAALQAHKMGLLDS